MIVAIRDARRIIRTDFEDQNEVMEIFIEEKKCHPSAEDYELQYFKVTHIICLHH